jgi:hypothetical protein
MTALFIPAAWKPAAASIAPGVLWVPLSAADDARTASHFGAAVDGAFGDLVRFVNARRPIGRVRPLEDTPDRRAQWLDLIADEGFSELTA